MSQVRSTADHRESTYGLIILGPGLVLIMLGPLVQVFDHQFDHQLPLGRRVQLEEEEEEGAGRYEFA